VLRPERDGWFELAEPYRGLAGTFVDRPIFSAWGERLRSRAGDPAELVLCGVATDCCVISTALDAIDDAAFVRVVEDACRGSSAASHDAAVTVLRGYAPQVTLTTVDEELRRAAVAAP
jgi:nicotinamidase-related amidase